MTFDGTWNLTIKTPVGPIGSRLDVISEGSTLTGTIVGKDGDDAPTPIFEGTVNGKAVAWKMKTTKPFPLTLKFVATVDGDTLAGRVKLGLMGSGEVTGTRTTDSGNA
jgi:hypothetical protein